MRAILTAPVDLLWNGGIGTYVKASSESHADVGDKANDAIRVDGADLRAKVVGEGGNLGLTQLGRIEFAGKGGHINTDAIDNTAGVDTSDHEVNIKILLDQAVRDGALAAEQRNALLAEMTDEVARLVLRDNYEQNVMLGNARVQASADALGARPAHRARSSRAASWTARWSSCPSEAEIEQRESAGQGLTSRELAVLVAYSKITLTADGAGDRPARRAVVHRRAARGTSRPGSSRSTTTGSASHPLRREIITTWVVNDLVNRGGMTFVFRMQEETGASPVEIGPRVRRGARGLPAGGLLGRRRGARQRAAHPRAGDALPRGAPAGRPQRPLAAADPAREHRRRRRGRALPGGAATSWSRWCPSCWSAPSTSG